jgi:O-antigen/teichoic acid export membrane protein
MGTIRKQSIVSSIFIYIGFTIGAVNILFLFPRYFTPEQFGLTRILVDIALILSTLCTAGAIPIAFKFFPYYESRLERKKNDLISIALAMVLLSCIVVYFLFPQFVPLFIRKFGARSPLLADHIHLVIPLTISLALLGIIEVFAWITGKTIVANFSRELLLRVFVMILIALWVLGLFKNYETWITYYSLVFLPLVVIVLLTVLSTKKIYFPLHVSSLTKRLSPLMLKFGGAYFLSALLNIIARTNDTLIIASQSAGGLADAAIFTIATYLITVMDVPQRSMISATTPQIAKAWKEKDLSKLDRLYKKTALNLLIIAAAILGLIIINIPILLSILGPLYYGLPVLLIVLGIGKLIDLGTGMNSQILQLSKYWRIDLFTNMLFVVVSIILNYFLTKKLGILGTAFGSLIAIIVFNLIRFVYIKKIYGLQPFTQKNAVALISAALMTAISFCLPISNLFLAGIIKSTVFITGYIFLTLKLNISSDMTELWQIAKNKLKK